MEGLHEIFNKHAPIIKKSFKVKSHTKKYVSASTLRLMLKRDKCYETFKRKPSAFLKAKLNTLKSKVKYQILMDTRNELDFKIQKKGLWKGINELFQVTKKSTPEFSLNPNEINDYFVNISIPDPSQNSNFQFLQPNTQTDQTFHFCKINPLELASTWKTMKHVKSTSMDTLNISNY